MPVQIRPSQLPLCPQTSPCNTGSCCCSHLHGRDCPISQVSTRRDTSHLSCTQELWSQGTGQLPPAGTRESWQHCQAGSSGGFSSKEWSLLWERAGIRCTGGKYGIRLPDGTAHRTWTKSNASRQKHGTRKGRVATNWTQFYCHHYIWPADDTLLN